MLDQLTIDATWQNQPNSWRPKPQPACHSSDAATRSGQSAAREFRREITAGGRWSTLKKTGIHLVRALRARLTSCAGRPGRWSAWIQAGRGGGWAETVARWLPQQVINHYPRGKTHRQGKSLAGRPAGRAMPTSPLSNLSSLRTSWPAVCCNLRLYFPPVRCVVSSFSSWGWARHRRPNHFVIFCFSLFFLPFLGLRIRPLVSSSTRRRCRRAPINSAACCLCYCQ